MAKPGFAIGLVKAVKALSNPASVERSLWAGRGV